MRPSKVNCGLHYDCGHNRVSSGCCWCWRYYYHYDSGCDLYYCICIADYSRYSDDCDYTARAGGCAHAHARDDGGCNGNCQLVW